MSLSNRVTLAELAQMPVGTIAALPADQLALLQEEAEAAFRSVKANRDTIECALALKYGDHAQALRQAEGKDTGTVRFEDGLVTVVADLPKKVEWDQKHLAAMVERIRAAGDDPGDYVDTSYKVPERKYSAWPGHVFFFPHAAVRRLGRAAFAAARTVKTGKPTFRLDIEGEGS